MADGRERSILSGWNALGRVDELETPFVRQRAKDGVERPAERIGDTVKGLVRIRLLPFVSPEGLGLQRPILGENPP